MRGRAVVQETPTAFLRKNKKVKWTQDSDPLKLQMDPCLTKGSVVLFGGRSNSDGLHVTLWKIVLSQAQFVPAQKKKKKEKKRPFHSSICD